MGLQALVGPEVLPRGIGVVHAPLGGHGGEEHCSTALVELLKALGGSWPHLTLLSTVFHFFDT